MQIEELTHVCGTEDGIMSGNRPMDAMTVSIDLEPIEFYATRSEALSELITPYQGEQYLLLKNVTDQYPLCPWVIYRVM